MPSARGRDLTLLVPGLFGPAPPAGVNGRDARQSLVEGLNLYALESLLSHARRVALAHDYASPDDLCFGLAGYQRSAGADWPVAAVTYRADTGAGPPGWCLRADPVHLKADLNDLVLFDGGQFDLPLDDTRALEQVVARHFEQAGFRLEVHHPSRWYLLLNDAPKIHTTPLSEANMQPVAKNLPVGEGAAQWRAYLNDSQMLLHECDINDARIARGEVPINSLWFWGGGTLPDSVPADRATLYADNALAHGLGMMSNSECHSLPSDCASGILRQSGEGNILAVIDDGFTPARSRDVESWRAFIVDLERNWLVPLHHALETGNLLSLTVVSDVPVRFEIRPARWWQRIRSIRSFADLAQSLDVICQKRIPVAG